MRIPKSALFIGRFAVSGIMLFFADPAVESDYRARTARHVLLLNRVALVLAFVMYTVFLFLDVTLVPETFRVQTAIRLAASATIVLTFLGTFHSGYPKVQEAAIAFPILVCGDAHYLMAFLSHLPHDYVRSAVSLMLIYTYFFSGMRYRYALAVATSLLLAYFVGCVLVEKLTLFTAFYQGFWLVSTNTIGMLCAYVTELVFRRSYVQSVLLEEEMDRSERLLRNILPEPIARELREHGSAPPERYESVSVLFCDIVGFTGTAEKMPPEELVRELDDYFTRFDDIARRYGVEKLKTIGDAYMCAAGVPVRSGSHAQDACRMALEMLDAVRAARDSRQAAGHPSWEMRIGIHTGPVVAGVIGKFKFAYDIWGDTVNTASRVETAGEPGKVNISAETYRQVKDLFDCEHRGTIATKGKKDLEMYFLVRQRAGVERASAALRRATSAE